MNGGSGPASGVDTLTVDTSVIATTASVNAVALVANSAATTAEANAAALHLPLAGGTLTGSLTGTTANFAGVTSAVVTSTGVVATPALISAGPTFTSDGGCSESMWTGKATAGSFVSGTIGTGTCTLTITMGNSTTAPHG